MHILKTHEATAVWDINDPTQVIRESWVPGNGWTSSYFNTVPTQSTLNGLGDFSWAGLPSWAQVGIVAAVSAAAGYFGMTHFGTQVRGVAKRFGLAGHHRRRR